ncbi:ABC transporter permease subunit [Nocardiopsis sp. CNT-189]|uniref:ABC transporter permease n=1 Tax=Nocardiopsis oceanisediminis TaxID=2816862 RepID=UPI003B2E5643
MLVHSRGARAALHAVFFALFLPVFALPFAVVLAASFAGNWSGALPSSWTLGNYTAAVSGDSLQALNTSLVTAAVASAAALTAGTWAALAAQRLGRRARTAVDAVFMLPVAVPSVVVGLALLVAFSAPPLLLNGTRWIVMLAHAVLVTAFAYQSLTAALARLDPAYEQAAAGLGGRPGYVLWKVKLPLLLPSLGAAAGLCFALSMGELSATMMLYPPDWLPLPVRIFASTDRGALYTGAALAVLLMAATLTALVLLSRVRSRAEQR